MVHEPIYPNTEMKKKKKGGGGPVVTMSPGCWVLGSHYIKYAFVENASGLVYSRSGNVSEMYHSLIV